MAIWDDWEPGFSKDQLRRAEDRFGFRFPPDLFDFLLQRRLPGGYDWAGDGEPIRDKLAWPLEGMLFDIENNAFWFPEWGEKPETEAARAEIATAAVARAPRLIPLYGHRYMPSEPHEAGNPVLSVWQTDIICYGADLWNYFENEYGVPHCYAVDEPVKPIAFWSEVMDRVLDVEGGQEP